MSYQASVKAEALTSFQTAGFEKDRGTRSVDFLKKIYADILKIWIEPRGVMQVADKDVEHMLHYVRLETAEMLAELEGSEFDRDAYAREAIDVLVILSSLAMNNGIVPDFAALAQKTNGQAPNETKFIAQIEQLTRIESIHEIDDPVALKAHLDKLYSVVFSFIHHGPALPSPEYILHALDMVLAKNNRNYPQQYFQTIHWQTGRQLSLEEVSASYYHTVRCLRLIRKHNGNNSAGLNEHDHQPYRFFIWDFENSESRVAELEAVLQQELVLPTVFPTGLEQKPLVSAKLKRSGTVYAQ